MSNKAGKWLVSELRFPAFRETGKWVEEFGDQVFKQVNNRQHDSNLPVLAITQQYGAIPRNDIDYRVFVTDKSIESYKVVDVGDFIISLRSFQGGIEYSSYRGICSPAYVILRMKADASAAFFKHLFKTERFVRQLNKNIEGLRDGKMVSFKQFSELLLPLPLKKDEQEQIAACLSSLDDLIAVQARKIETLKAHKKALMQQLFPAEGEAIPRLRFPEFRRAGVWKESKAEKLFANRVDKGKSGLPLYSVTISDGMIKRSSLDRDFDDIAEPEGNKKAHRLDIAYNMMRMWQGACGVAGENCMVSPAYIVLAPKKGVNSVFFSYLFKLPQYLKKLTSHSRGLTLDRLRLYYKDFVEISLLYPSVQEQKRIADCFASVDELIRMNIQKFEAMKSQKQGLMQGLFPSSDEV